MIELVDAADAQNVVVMLRCEGGGTLGHLYRQAADELETIARVGEPAGAR